MSALAESAPRGVEGVATKIVVYYPDALRGEFGTASSVRGWCGALAAAGADVRLVVDRDFVGLVAPDGVELEAISHTFFGRVRRPASLSAALRGADVLVLAGAGTLANIVAGREARRLGIPYVVAAYGVLHSRVLDRKSGRKRLWYLALERRHLRRALAVHLFFPDEREGLSKLGVDVPVVLVPTGFTPPAGLTWQGDGGYLLWLGRFDVQTKGLDLLLGGFQLLAPAERPRLLLHGPDWRGGRSDVRALVSRLGLAGSVSVGEPVYGEEKWRLLSGAAGFVHPSRWDACPVSVLEAASIGVPTLTTPYPLGQFLGARGGAIVADATPEGIAVGIRKLLAPEAAEVGRSGARAVREELSWPGLAAAWLARMDNLLAGVA